MARTLPGVTVLLVAGAGALGVLARYGISSAFHGDVLPWVTVAINVVGSFALGVLVVSGGSEQVRVALGVGFLGGFTTYSTFAVQAWLFADAGDPGRGLLLVLVSVLAGVGAAAAGVALGRAL